MELRKAMIIGVMILTFVPGLYADTTGELPNWHFAIRSVSDPDIVVEFFSDLRDVIEVLGNPLAHNDQPTDFSADDLDEYVYDGLFVGYVNEDNAPQTVAYMRIFNDRYETVGGVRVGMGREAVIALYGPPVPDFDQLLSDFDREHGTSVMRYTAEVPYALGGWYLIKLLMDERDRVAHIIFTIITSA